MNSKRHCITLICLVFQLSFSQENSNFDFPEIGKKCPDYLFKEIKYNNKAYGHLHDFKYKAVILDFWSSICLSCIEAFPHTDSLQQFYKKDLKFILVGTDDEHIRPVFEKYRKRWSLNLTVVFDSNLWRQIGLTSYPELIWVDSLGIVKAITMEDALTPSHIEELLKGQKVEVSKKFNVKERDREIVNRGLNWNIAKPFLIGGNGGRDTAFLFRSLLSAFTDSIGEEPPYAVAPVIYKNLFQCSGIPLEWLYRYAYGDTTTPLPLLSTTNEKNRFFFISSYGNWWRDPVLELKDSSDFIWDGDSVKNRWNYSLIVPPSLATAKKMQDIMQRDLQNYFGYDVSVETKIMPCWNLIIANGANQNKLLTKGGDPFAGNISGTAAGFTLRNVPVSDLITYLWVYFQMEPPFIDKTGIVGNIDLKIDAAMIDFNEVLAALRKNGLDLIKGNKEMKVIVIRDKKS